MVVSRHNTCLHGLRLQSNTPRKDDTFEKQDMILLDILPRDPGMVPPCFGGLTPIYPHFDTILRDF